MSENEKTHDMVNTTDCLEAVNAFKAMKNFLFFFVLICLLLLQATFWLQQLGYIDKTACQGAACGMVCSGGSYAEGASAAAGAEDVSEVSAEAESGTIEAHAELATADVGDESGQPAEPVDTTEPVEADGQEAKIRAKFTLKCRQAATLIWVCNFILVITATLYCFTLLISIKISLVGQLGGINHICRAFLLSLFGLVLVLPWQRLFGDVVAGAIYTPQELLNSVAPTAEDSAVSQVFYYLRFVMLWVITFMLFFFAQVRSARWTGATLRRLGMIH
jgi:hypothetical protein